MSGMTRRQGRDDDAGSFDNAATLDKDRAESGKLARRVSACDGRAKPAGIPAKFSRVSLIVN